MQARAKPDSSYASNKLTRSNPPKRHLLSTYNKVPEESTVKSEVESKPVPKEPVNNEVLSTDSDSDLSLLNSDDLQGEWDDSDVQPKRDPNEPATDDEPVSSGDEAGDDGDDSDGDDKPQRPTEDNKQSLNEKLANNDGSQKPSLSGWRGDRGRTSSSAFGKGSDDDSDGPWFSQPSKRLKTSKSYSRNKPFSSAPTPNSQGSKSNIRKENGKKEDEPSEDPESHMGFKAPTQIDISSPTKPRATKASKEASPGFKVPSIFPIDEPSSSSFGPSSLKALQPTPLEDDSPLSSHPSPLSSPPLSDAPPPKSLCPWCRKEVDPEMLMLFEAQPKQRLREQQKFCASHQQDTAEREWEAQGYPEINWERFDERAQKHFPDLEQILVPDCFSYYRNILDENLKSGKAKNFRLTLDGDGLETISCGYYGTRGAAKMLQVIVDRFSLRLRRLAATDEIVKKAGVAGYAQSVLVPELAVRLVKEDMGVDDDSARQILRDSIAIGQKLNPALDDVVPIEEEPEELAQE